MSLDCSPDVNLANSMTVMINENKDIFYDQDVMKIIIGNQ